MAAEGSSSTTSGVGPDPGIGARAAWARRGFIAFLAIVVLVGLLDLLGVKSRTVDASSPDGAITLDVHYAQIARAGLDVPFRITVERPGGFDQDMTVAVSSDVPRPLRPQSSLDPDASVGDGNRRHVIWQFDPPPGDTLEISVDMQVQGGRHWGRTGAVPSSTTTVPNSCTSTSRPGWPPRRTRWMSSSAPPLSIAFVWLVLRALGKRELGELTAVRARTAVRHRRSRAAEHHPGRHLGHGGHPRHQHDRTADRPPVLLSLPLEGPPSGLEGTPVVLVYEGRVMDTPLHRERMTVDDLKEAARAQGIADLADIKIAILENEGKVSFITFDRARKAGDGDRPAA